MSPGRDQEFIDRLSARLRREEEPEEAARNGNGHASHALAPTDEMVIEKCRNAKNAAKFASLYDDGDLDEYGGNASDADFGLLRILAFYSQDPDQLERLMSESELGQRGKWKQRSDYRNLTIENVLKKGGQTYDWGRDFVSSSSHPYTHVDDDDTSDDVEVVWFSEEGEPEEREYLIEKVCVKGYPIVTFGAGGVAKSFAVLAAGVAIASPSPPNPGSVDKWLGMRILEHGHVVYVDFELDKKEQHRRIRDVCAGLEVPIPNRLAYVSGVGHAPGRVFRKALELAERYGAKAVIIDSMGWAMAGARMDSNDDVIAFHAQHINPFRRVGATPFIVDHEGKLQTGEKHKSKGPIGGAFKTWAARNVLQFELNEYDKEASALDVRVRQYKTNFEPVNPFGVRFTFEPKKISIEARELDDDDLIEEDRIPVRDRIVTVLGDGPATINEMHERTGAEVGTIRNVLSQLSQAGKVTDDGKRPKTFNLVSSSSQHPRGESDDDTSFADEKPDPPADCRYVTDEEGLSSIVDEVRGLFEPEEG